MSNLPPIASLWVGARLSWLEQVVLKSWRALGHDVTLYALEPPRNVPDGVIIADARDILAPPFDLAADPRHRIATYSDLFRLALFSKTDAVWVDCDAYGVAPLDKLGPNIFGWGPKRVLTGVLRLEAGSPALAAMRAFVSEPSPIQPWRNAEYRARREGRRARGDVWGIVDLPWGCAGPQLLHHCLTETGEIEQALPKETFYPAVTEDAAILHRPLKTVSAIERRGTRSVHIFGSQRELLRLHRRGLPVPGSYLAMICARHHVRPEDAPIR